MEENTDMTAEPKVSASFVGTMVDKTWQTFGIFAVLFFVFVNLFHYLVISFTFCQQK